VFNSKEEHIQSPKNHFTEMQEKKKLGEVTKSKNA